MKFEYLKRIFKALALASFATGAHALTDIGTCQTISQPGSYRLTQNLQTDARDCLIITVPNVTLDLQGHSVSGIRHLLTRGISVPNAQRLHNIVVRNGTVAFFGVGVSLGGATHNVRVENLQVHGNSNFGIHVGSGSIVASNSVYDNGGFGILVRSSAPTGDGAMVVDNLVLDNGFDGILIEEPGSTVSGNISRRNGQDGIEVRCPSNVQNNTSTQSVSGFVDLRFRTGLCVDVNNVAIKKLKE